MSGAGSPEGAGLWAGVDLEAEHAAFKAWMKRTCRTHYGETEQTLAWVAWRERAAVDAPKRRIPPRVELGCAGHLIVAARCRWRRHTQVGNFRISSVGNYFPDKDGKRDTIGAGDDAFFETMVFKTSTEPAPGNEGCGCFAVEDWSEIDGERYATAGEAQAGHERYVAKYSDSAPEEHHP